MTALGELADHPLVGEVRGIGMLGAIELVQDKATKKPFDPAFGAFIGDAAQQNGLISRPLGNAIALCPPLIISEAEIDEMFDRLETALEAGVKKAAAEA